MIAKFTRKRIIQWYAPSNSSINHTTPFQDYERGFNLRTNNIPSQGDYILKDGQKYKVLSVIYDLDNVEISANVFDEVKYATIEYESKIITVSYYEYISTFTGGFLTNGANKQTVIFPTTWDEWIEDIRILEDIKKHPENYSSDDMEKLKSRRCKPSV